MSGDHNMNQTSPGWRKRTIMEMAREAWAEAGEGWVADAWFDDRAKAFAAFAAMVREDERDLVITEFVKRGVVSEGGAVVAEIRSRSNT